MSAVIDASALIGVFEGRIRSLPDAELHAPDILDVEMVSALRGIVRGGALGASEARENLDLLGEMAITRHPSARRAVRMWELRDNISPYDAAYVTLAEALGLPLITLDGRLARAAVPYCEVLAPEVVDG